MKRTPYSRFFPAITTGNLVRIGLLLSFAFFFLVPLLWFLAAPTKTDAQLTFGQAISFGSWQRLEQTWTNLLSYNNGQILVWARNSAVYVLSGLFLSLAVCIPAGYALAISNFPGRRMILILTLITMILPSSATVLPLFLGMNSLKLLNTMIGVILPSGFFPFGVYLSFIYFATSVPRDLLNAARIEGCNEFQVFQYMALPLAAPTAALVAFFSFVGNWNNFYTPYVLLTNDNLYNLPVGLAALISSSGALNGSAAGSALPINRPEVALAGLLVVLPIALVFLFSQRYLQTGLLAGAEKG